jgi:hypothetical protein
MGAKNARADIERVNAIAREFASQSQKTEDRFQDERTEKARLFEAIAIAAKPALEGASSQLLAGENGATNDYGRGGSRVDSAVFPQRGIVLVGLGAPAAERPRIPHRANEHSSLSMTNLVLLEDGSYASVIAEGEWEAESGTFWWTANLEPMTPEEVAENRWSPQAVAQALAEELEAQLDGKQKVGEKAAVATERIRAVAILLEGIR